MPTPRRVSPENFKAIASQGYSWFRVFSTFAFPPLLAVGLISIVVEQISPGTVSTTLSPTKFLWWAVIIGLFSSAHPEAQPNKLPRWWQAGAGVAVGLVFLVLSLRLVWGASAFLMLGIVAMIISFISFIFFDNFQTKPAGEKRNFALRFTGVTAIGVVVSRVLIFAFVSGTALWFINQNVAIFGKYTAKIENFLHMPRSVSFSPGYEAAIFDSPTGLVARPLKDRVEFQVTLPRGFDSLKVSADIAMDIENSVTLSAKTLDGDADGVYIVNPAIFQGEWKTFNTPNGKILSRNKNVDTLGDFWDTYFDHERIIGIGPNVEQLLPSVFTESPTQETLVSMPLRGDFTLSALLGENTKSIKFTKQDLNFQRGPDTLTVTLSYKGKRIARFKVDDDGNISTGKGSLQDSEFLLSDLAPGFYTFTFDTNGEDSFVRNLTFIGSEVRFGKNIFLGPEEKPMTLYTDCKQVEAQAVKASGLQTINFGGKNTIVKKAKENVIVSASAVPGKILFTKGDINFSTSCGFTLQEKTPMYSRYQKYLNRIESNLFTQSAFAKADAVLDTSSIPITTKHGLRIEHTFQLSELAAKGRTFTFVLSSPGLQARPGAYLYVEKVSFVAKRPSFRLTDIKKAFMRVF